MQPLLTATLKHLERLTAFDTQNPPRAISADGGLVAYLRAELEAVGFALDVGDHGEGCVSVLATRGLPEVLFNVHLDTVPATEGWSADPHTLRVTDGRAIGLGACDIKGAAACLLAAAAHADGPAAFLFTTDEEAGQSTCVRRFCEGGLGLDAGGLEVRGVLVAEPTGAKAVVEHRGIRTVHARFEGTPGHASEPRALADSALHRAMVWGARAVDLAGQYEADRRGDLSGIRFNVGRVEGGIKNNVIAPSAGVTFGFRPMPGQDADGLQAAFAALANAAHASFERGFDGPALPANPSTAKADARAAARLAGELGLELGPAVDFWTEAPLFSRRGYPTLVFGPGDIAQAHTADEWVALDQLERVGRAYATILSR